jgi:hypothetical protein
VRTEGVGARAPLALALEDDLLAVAVAFGQTRGVDRAGPMPHEAWYEIRDTEGDLIETVSAKIAGGTVSAELPAFPPGSRGRIELCMRWTGEEKVVREEDLRDLPSRPASAIVQTYGLRSPGVAKGRF